MKYAILYKPTDEYIAFFEDGKTVLFTNNESKARDELADLLFTDGGYDGPSNDFQVVMVDADTDGNEYIVKKDAIDGSDNIFVSRSSVDV